MSLHSLDYLFLLMLAWPLTMARRSPLWRKGWLLAFSYLFYGWWSTGFLFLLIVSSLANWLWANHIGRNSRPRMIWIGVGFNVALLAFFKYAGLLEAGPTWWQQIVLPVGLSFYTFQAISYQIDVYRGYAESPSLLEFALYMAFWPTVLSGPVCRVPEMLPQFRGALNPAPADLALGVRRIVLGLFMKVVLADSLAQGVGPWPGIDQGFSIEPGLTNTWDVLVLAVGFGLQLFFDFCGYSHTAIGSARLFGLRLRENFDQPYLSLNIAEFWTRWHMSLSSWIRDYLFFPLASWRRSQALQYGALVLSMVLFGIWHGIGWTFFWWGLYHGLLLVAHRLAGRTALRVAKPVAWALTFLSVNAGWIFFRSESMESAVARVMALGKPGQVSALDPGLYSMVLVFGTVYLLATFAWNRLQNPLQTALGQRIADLVTPACLVTMLVLIIIFSDSSSPFVYVRF